MTLVPAPDLRSPFDVAGLRCHGDAPAVLGPDRIRTYAELADEVEDLLARIGPARRLLLVRAVMTPETVVAIVAGLCGGHAVLIAPDDDAVVARWTAVHRPDVIVRPAADGTGVEVLRDLAEAELHPDLSLLLGTSGSTGAPRLVRLSRTNVESNAASIAAYLGLTAQDRGLLHLPLHYCYGLSVLTSHLSVGAGLVVTDLSVVDDGFWDLVGRHGVTGLPGVPYTFDLLESVDFSTRTPATLRYVTQAGGKLAPERVAALAARGRDHGWDLFVMYGQTEATARMAYLPPALAAVHPHAIGRAIPGGHLSLREVLDGVGELVYAGPNVMMGYAESPADLATGPGAAELATGDLAREIEPGLFEVVGRRSRFAKVFGLRLDLDDVERHLLAEGVEAGATELDGRLWLLVAGDQDTAARAERLTAQHCGIPRWSLHTTHADALPRTTTGKTDTRAVAAACRAVGPVAAGGPGGADVEVLCGVFARLLDRDVVRPEDSFVGLGADSLSFIAVSTELSRRLGELPSGWQHLSIAELAASHRRRRTTLLGTAPVDTGVVLRAAAIVVVVATHADVLTFPGGAHVLLALAGFNLARFLSAERPARSLARAAWRVALPSALWIGALALVGREYVAGTAALVNGWVGSDGWDAQWRFWFVEALVWPTLAAAALLTLAPLRRLERRAPFGVALAAWAVALGLRWAWTGLEAGPTERYTGAVVAWCLALGWLAARASTPWKRLAVTVAAPLSVAGFFGEPQREAVVVAGVLALVWLPTVRVPRLAVRPIAAVAAASLSVYLTHWVVYPHLEVDHPVGAVLASFAVGLAYHRLSTPVVDHVDRGLTRAIGRVRRR